MVFVLIIRLIFIVFEKPNDNLFRPQPTQNPGSDTVMYIATTLYQSTLNL